MAVKDLTFRLFGEDASATQSLNRLRVAANRTGKSFDESFGTTKKVLGGVALAGAGAIALLVKTGIGEAMDASAGNAQLEAGIKSTGNAANTSVKQMNDLASSIQDYSGQTDDSISKTQALLLTFTNIRNNGPDKVFDQATVAAADMAARMGGDASSKAVMLGKALNDPVKGLSKLTKVGVSFTEAQEKQVKAMVKAGDTAGAQKVILGELNKEFGGSAKAAGESLPGQLQRVQRAFEDVSQTVLEAILPVVTPAIGKITDAIKASTPALTSFAQGFIGFGAWVLANGNWLLPIVAGVIGMVAAFRAYIAIVNIVRVATVAWTAVQTILNVTMSANPIGLIVIAIGILIAAIVFLVLNWSSVCAFLQKVWGAVCKWFADTLTLLGTTWRTLWSGIANFFTTVWGRITGFINGAIRVGIAALRIMWSQAVGFLRALFNGYVGFWRGVWTGILNFVKGIPGKIKGVFSGAVNWLRDAGKNILDGLVGGIRGAVTAVISTITGIAKNVISTFASVLGIHSPSTVFAEHGENIVAGLVGGISGGKSAVDSAVAGIAPEFSASTSGVYAATPYAGTGASAAGGGVAVYVTVQGAVVGSKHELAKYLTEVFTSAQRNGVIPRNSIVNA